jgi:hypothetical protein
MYGVHVDGGQIYGESYPRVSKAFTPGQGNPLIAPVTCRLS